MYDELENWKFHLLLLLILMVGWTLDSMNSGIISGTLTLIIKELKMTSEQAGTVLSSWLVGMLFGAFLIGFMGDRVGRKTAIVSSLFLMGLFSAASALVKQWEELALYRFFAGIGSAGYMVAASTLLSEYAPREVRGRMVAILESAWALGWLASLLLARMVAPSIGWRPVFSAGLLTLILVPVVWLAIPESIRYLLNKGKEKEARKIAKKIGLRDLPYEEITEKPKLSELFRGEYLRRTVMLWIHWFCIVLAYWGIFLWLPHILYARGIAYVRSLEYAIAITLAQIPGYLSAAYLIEKIGRKKTLTAYMALAGLGSFFFWSATSDLESLLFAVAISFFNLGAWGVTYAYTPELYPTRLRATGSGWANSIGRVGGILGPYIVGYLLSTTGSPLVPFLLFAAVHFVSAVTVAALGVETMGRSLEEISR